MTLLSKLLLLTCCSISLYGYAQDGKDEQPITNTNAAEESCGAACTCGQGTQTPLGVMTDHVHPKGTWMLSYSYMDMQMKGSQTGTTFANDNMVYQQYMMAPETMTMHMHMAMLMYALTDRLTLMGMGGYVTGNMNMRMAMNMPNMPGMNMSMGNTNMQSTSSGITDTKVYGLYNLSGKDAHRFIASMGISAPTGTIKATGTTMLGVNERLPYNMQPGTGSFSILPGITYIRQFSLCSLGADAGADIKMNSNPLGYKQGNVYHATVWGSRKLFPFVSASLRAEEIITDKITGADPAIAIPIYEADDPTANTANYGGKVVTGYAGLNFHVDNPVLKNFQLMCEYGMPLYQNLNGTQLAYHNTLIAGLQYKF